MSNNFSDKSLHVARHVARVTFWTAALNGLYDNLNVYIQATRVLKMSETAQAAVLTQVGTIGKEVKDSIISQIPADLLHEVLADYEAYKAVH